MLTVQQRKRVAFIWNTIDGEGGSVSAERRIEMTRERASRKLGVSVSKRDVVDAIESEFKLREQVAGEVGFGGMVVRFCPKHGNVIACSCPGGKI